MSEEESVFNSFIQDVKTMPLDITKNFSVSANNSSSRRAVKDMLKRFTEKTKTFEYVVKFDLAVEKTEESSIALGDHLTAEMIDQKERRRFIRKEVVASNRQQLFTTANKAVENKLFPLLINVVTQANQMLKLMHMDKYEKFKEDKKLAETMTKNELSEYKKNNHFVERAPRLDKLKLIEM